MNITSILSIATAFVAFSISAHAAEVFSFSADEDRWPTAKSTADFNAVDADGNRTYPYETFGNTDAGSGVGWGGAVTANFDGTTPIANPGDQNVSGIHTTTWMGPSFYAGLNRDVTQIQAGAIHSHGNGFRIRVNNIGAGLINDQGVGPTGKAVFMFDADLSSLSGDSDNLIFGDSDTITAKVAAPAAMGPAGGDRASAASYRAMVKANGEYYAGSLQTIDLSTIPASGTLTVDMSESCADTSWTLMPSMDGSDYDSIATNPAHPQNLTVDTSESATTVLGKFLTNITQVGFYLETTAKESSGGYNFGVREFAAQATPASAPHPIEWSEDFINTIDFLTTTSNKVYDLGGNPLTGYGHAYKWSTSGGTGTTLSQDNGTLTMTTTVNGSAGELHIHMIGAGTETAQRRVKPVSHETTFEIDLIAFKNGSADLMLQTRGQDGWVRSTIAPSGQVKWTTWMSDYTHTNFNNFSGETRLRNNANNPGIVIVDGGTFDPSSTDPVTATITGNAVIDSVVMTDDGTAVASVTLSNYGSGYTAEPTVTFSGGGMTVAPTVSFNYSTGNIGGSIVKEYHLGDDDQDGTVDNWSLLADGQILTYIQSYDNADDSLSYYYSLDGSEPVFITKLTAADHSAGGAGYGFFDVFTGNRWGQPNNQDAVKISYKRYGAATAEASTVGINSITVATSDGDRDGIIDRNDEFPANPFESADADGDGVGDNSDAYPGLDDSVFTLIHSAAQTAGDTAFSTYVNDNADNYSYSVGGGAITQEAYDAAVAALAVAVAAQEAAEAALDNAPTLADVEQTVMDARAGSTRIDVSDGVASITLTLEETSDLGDWSSPTTTDHNIQLSAPAGSNFYRFKIAD